MTSAVLAGRNEVHPHHHHWAGGDARALMPKPSNPNPRRHHHHRPTPPPPRPSSAAATAPYVPEREPEPEPEPEPSGRVTIRPSDLSDIEARALRSRLTGELGRVRALLSRIDAWEDERRLALQPPPPPPPHPHPPPHRHVVLPPALQAAMRKRCAQILTRLRKQKTSVWFNKPVDVEKLKLHDYHAVIRSPMDLGTVKENLSYGRYPSHETFAADVRLTFNNALRYNPPDHNVHRYAGNLLATFESLYKDAVSWFDSECLRLESPMPPVPVPMPVQAPPRMIVGGGGGGKRLRPKPKAREPNKREMSEEEKNRLRVEIENLPEDKMGNVLLIVQKRSADPALMGEVVELDFDEMDVETLWELDRFVVNCKKALNRNRKTVVMNGDAVDVMIPVDGDAVDVMIPVVQVDDGAVPVNPEQLVVVDIGDSENDVPEKRASEAEMVDEYVDIGDEMPAANYQSVEIEKDAHVASSSSGSGSASSSSSGSDSRSSGDSDSDGDEAQSPD